MIDPALFLVHYSMPAFRLSLGRLPLAEPKDIELTGIKSSRKFKLSGVESSKVNDHREEHIPDAPGRTL
ncbi:MAG: hypothetical protein KJ668_09175 [Proteobacteria bacterium]|nr:hypothetical protein [Pseudomonadota bacterium]